MGRGKCATCNIISGKNETDVAQLCLHSRDSTKSLVKPHRSVGFPDCHCNVVMSHSAFLTKSNITHCAIPFLPPPTSLITLLPRAVKYYEGLGTGHHSPHIGSDSQEWLAQRLQINNQQIHLSMVVAEPASGTLLNSEKDGQKRVSD